MSYCDSFKLTKALRSVLRPSSNGLVRYALAALLWIPIATTHALTVSEINRYLQAGQADEGLRQIDLALQQQPTDYTLNFSKAVILAGKNNLADAKVVFEQLLLTHPNQPELLNNLAVLYAREGKTQQARKLLDRALNTAPTYALIQQNIGNLNARLASESYAKALRIDNSQSLSKLASTLNLARATPNQEVIAPVVLVAAVKEPINTQPATTAANQLPLTPASPAVLPTPAEIVALTPAANKRPSKVNPVNAANAIEQVTLEWAQAWSARDLATYFSFYHSQYKPTNMTRQAWQADRQLKIENKSEITVTLSGFKIVALPNNRYRINFRQDYRADGFRLTGPKYLNWEKENEQWKIIEEAAR